MVHSRIQNFIICMYCGLLFVSLFFAPSMHVFEFVQFAILGAAILTVFILAPAQFSRSWLRVSILTLGLGYILYMCDPAVNGDFFFTGERAPVFNLYRIISSGILLITALVTGIALLRKEDGRTQFATQWKKYNMYVAGVIIGLMVATIALELLSLSKTNITWVYAVLRGTKYIDYFLIYVIVISAFPPETEDAGKQTRVHILLYMFLSACAFVTLIGAGKATQAYSYVRIPEFESHAKKKRWFPNDTSEMRQKLLRVFSLNSREALLIYEAGYHAGKKELEKSQKALQKADPFSRYSLEEKRVEQYISTGVIEPTIPLLDSFPSDYTFASYTTQELVYAVQDILSSPPVPNYAYYAAGVLSLRCGVYTQSQIYLSGYLQTYSNHANAVYFYHYHNTNALTAYSSLRLPFPHWFTTPVAEKKIEMDDNALRLMYNQHVKGTAWLLPGKYEVQIWAKDSGTPYSEVKDTHFDPTCKARVWVGNDDFYTLNILSTNGQFSPYVHTIKVNEPRVQISLEFINDTYDDEHGWDRNLSVSHIDFIRKDGDL